MKQRKYYYLLAAIITLVATVFFFIKDFVVLDVPARLCVSENMFTAFRPIWNLRMRSSQQDLMMLEES